jgi:hypothetical protein
MTDSSCEIYGFDEGYGCLVRAMGSFESDRLFMGERGISKGKRWESDGPAMGERWTLLRIGLKIGLDLTV